MGIEEYFHGKVAPKVIDKETGETDISREKARAASRIIGRDNLVKEFRGEKRTAEQNVQEQMRAGLDQEPYYTTHKKLEKITDVGGLSSFEIDAIADELKPHLEAVAMAEKNLSKSGLGELKLKLEGELKTLKQMALEALEEKGVTDKTYMIMGNENDLMTAAKEELGSVVEKIKKFETE